MVVVLVLYTRDKAIRLGGVVLLVAFTKQNKNKNDRSKCDIFFLSKNEVWSKERNKRTNIGSSVSGRFVKMMKANKWTVAQLVIQRKCKVPPRRSTQVHRRSTLLQQTNNYSSQSFSLQTRRRWSLGEEPPPASAFHWVHPFKVRS